MAEILVLGAGMVGVSTALALQARGHMVRLMDRRAPGKETSFGNAGVIQAEARAPYAFPRDPLVMARVALGQSNDVLLDPAALPGQAEPLARYFHQSAPARHARHAADYGPLIARASTDHEALFTEAGAAALIRRSGLGQLYDDQASLEAAYAEAEALAKAEGLRLTLLEGQALVEDDPALQPGMAGGFVWHDTWSCTNPGALVAAYARLFERRGGVIETGAVTGVEKRGFAWVTLGAQAEAEHIVLALGPWTPNLLEPLGLRVPMVKKRGYHAHFPGTADLARPYLLGNHGVVIASMQQGLRITTGAHLTRMDAPQKLNQLEHGIAAVSKAVALADQSEAEVWQGTRPCLPDMVPLVGEVPGHIGLWVNFGHGHQGFTLGPTTGALLAEALDQGAVPDMMRPLEPLGRL